MQAMRNDIIVEPLSEKKEKSNLILSQTVIKETQGFKGKVISIGPKSNIGIEIGDIILYRPHEGKKVKEFLVIAERHILAKEIK